MVETKHCWCQREGKGFLFRYYIEEVLSENRKICFPLIFLKRERQAVAQTVSYYYWLEQMVFLCLVRWVKKTFDLQDEWRTEWRQSREELTTHFSSAIWLCFPRSRTCQAWKENILSVVRLHGVSSLSCKETFTPWKFISRMRRRGRFLFLCIMLFE